ncbi:MAG: DedA family protein [Thermoanaerobaculia bacterium]|nr:DedA family protein [Thermoanaerobaculia bacterium]
MTGLEDLITTVALLPPIALPTFILVSAVLEYVVPPFWGDTLILLSFFLCGQGMASAPVIFGAALIGSILGAMTAFLLGKRYGLSILRRVTKRRGGGHGQKMQRMLERFGERALTANRFLPVVRGFSLYAAGMLRLRFWRVLFYSTLSNLGWVALLMTIGLLGAGTFEQLQSNFQHVSRLVAATLVPLLAALAISAWHRVRRVRVNSSESAQTLP